ncbi:helix-turn-helix transcriptional regulator [Streptomyces sp. LRE541]|nr:helix-turn-helix transcriptional regulator [Streptomyces sp. LRE541]
MSLARLAALTGIDKGHLSKAERGLAGLGDDYIRKIADALDVTPDDITHKEIP